MKIIIIFLFIFSCSKSKESSTVNGVNSGEYYQQFISDDNERVLESTSGTFAQIVIKKDGTYNFNGQMDLQGTWSQSDVRLVFANLGEANGIRYNNQECLNIKILDSVDVGFKNSIFCP